MDIKEKISSLPALPGVYVFKDEDGAVIYVGKASSLRNRIRSYFQKAGERSVRIESMVGHIRDIEWIVTASEAEALLFEANLIKEYHPRYNVALRDDKSYPLIKITMADEYPRVIVARGKKSDGSLYFGPYADARLLRQAVKSLRRIFPFCTCCPLLKKACVYRDLGLCPAPCETKTSREEYLETINEIILFIEGKRDELLRKLSAKMKMFSDNRDFEAAARVRDQIEAFGKAILKKTKADTIGELSELKNVLGLRPEPRYIEAFDISNIKAEGACGSMVAFLDGRPCKRNYKMFKIREVKGQDDYAMMREVVRRRYSKRENLPDLILIDGGKGHLSSAAREINALGINGIPIIGIAKLFEHIYTLDRDEPIVLPPSSKALHLIQRIRDESHRFAIRYHHILRRKIVRESVLDKIAGVGPKRKMSLLSHFGSIGKLSAASVGQIRKVKGLNERTAKEIKKTLGRAEN
ncbi:MAG: excinuclease ABC subunit UvrC [Candidatus Omnitrophota bacterium]